MGYWDTNPTPTDAEIEIVVRGWISYQERQEAGEQSPPAEDPDWWAWEAVEDANQPGRIELHWRLILKLCELAGPDPAGVLGMVAAGPLYDHIAFRGGLGRVEENAPGNANLLAALGEVWADELTNTRIEELVEAQGRPRRRGPDK